MNVVTLVAVSLAGMLLLLGVFAAVQVGTLRAIRRKHPGYPKGYWMTQGIGIGLALGVGLGLALGHIELGLPVGVALGVAIGASLEKQHEAEIRPIVAEERTLQKQSVLVAVGSLIVAGVVVAILHFGVR